MARLTRKNIKVFAENAANNGVFGSLQAGDPTVTNDVETLQSLSAWGQGWNAATLSSAKLPPLEEIQGVEYVTTYQQAYLMQEGIPEWSATVTYYKGSIIKKNTTNGFQLYYSLTNNNTNHQTTDTSNWKLTMDSANSYAFESDVVKLTGNQTIAGTKTFTSVVRNTLGTTQYKTDFAKGDIPSSTVYWNMYNLDSNGSGGDTYAIGNFRTYLTTSNITSSVVEAFKNTSGSGAGAMIRMNYDTTADTYYADIYAIGAVGTNRSLIGATDSTTSEIIPTKGWVNNPSTSTNVVHRTGSETIAGVKTITTEVRFQHGSNTEYRSSIYRQLDNGFAICINEQDNSSWMSYLKFFTDGSAILRAKTTLSLQGSIKAPTPSTSDNSTKVATTEFVKNNLAGGVSTIATSNLTVNRALISGSTGKVQVSAVTNTELGYLDGVTSNLQTQLNAKAADNAVVKLTGNQSIAGTKTFTSNQLIVNGNFWSRNTTMTKGTAPSADQWTGFMVEDSANNVMGRFRERYTSAKTNYTELMAYKANSADDTGSATLGVAYPASGGPWAFAPASDINGSIVTTVNKSKAQNGYYKLGNGLIIQWGRKTYVSTDPQSVTFPTPFTSTNYKVVGSYYYDGDVTSGQDQISVSSQTTTGFTFYMTDTADRSVNWIAIGY